MASFQYSDDQWERVAAQLARHGEPTDDDRGYLENLAHNYQWFRDYTDPASPEVETAKTLYQDIVKHAGELLRSLDALAALPTKPSRLIPLQIAMADDPLEARAVYDYWKRLTQKQQESAAHEAIGFPKSVRGGNRSRGDVLDDYLRKLLEFWIARGGYPGKSPTGPCIQFILAAAGPVVPLEANTVSHFIREQSSRHANGQPDGHVALWRALRGL